MPEKGSYLNDPWSMPSLRQQRKRKGTVVCCFVCGDSHTTLQAKCRELYTQMSDAQEAWHHHLDKIKDKAWTCDEPLYQKYQQLSNETNQVLEAFKKLEWGCVREEKK